MSIKICKETCTGCKKCVSMCPGSLIKLDESGKAFIKYPQNCWGCVSCVKECEAQAVSFYLGADIGGRGSRLTVKREGNILNWIIEGPDGERDTVSVDSKNSNQY